MALAALGPAPLPDKSEPGYLPAVSAGDSAGKGAIQDFKSKDGASFSDVLDILNPLQHIPLVNTLYQKLTGDKEGAVADIVGGTLYGGAIGFGVALANLVVEDASGKSMTDNVVALFSDDSSDTAIAKAEPAPSAPVLAQAAAPADTDDDLAPAPATAPLPKVSSAPLKPTAPQTPTVSASLGTDGPVRAGDLLFFGGSPSTSGTPLAMNTLPAATVSVTTTVAANDGPIRQGDFLIFGGQAATSLPAGSPAQAPQAPAEAPVQTSQAPQASQASQATTDAAAAAGLHAVPARRAAVTPRATLPMPTTGPGALPGGQSQAKRGGDQDDATTGQAGGWFSGAFNQAMDKYQRSQRLGTDTPATPVN